MTQSIDEINITNFVNTGQIPKMAKYTLWYNGGIIGLD